MLSVHLFTFPHPRAQLKEVVEGTAPHFGVKVEWDLAMVYADDPDGVPEQADEDTLGVVRKLVHDAALMLGPRVEVTLDGRVLPATAEQYLRLYKDAQLMGWVAFFYSLSHGKRESKEKEREGRGQKESEKKRKRKREGGKAEREREKEKEKRRKGSGREKKKEKEQERKEEKNEERKRGKEREKEGRKEKRERKREKRKKKEKWGKKQE